MSINIAELMNASSKLPKPDYPGQTYHVQVETYLNSIARAEDIYLGDMTEAVNETVTMRVFQFIAVSYCTPSYGRHLQWELVV